MKTIFYWLWVNQELLSEWSITITFLAAGFLAIYIIIESLQEKED